MKLLFNNMKLNRQIGLTLVELMVSMVISLLLIAGTITIFMSNKQAYRLNEASSRVQENGRFAIDFLKRDVRMAGYFGCIGPASNIKIKNNVDKTKYKPPKVSNAHTFAFTDFDGTDSIRGYQFAGTLDADMTNLGLVAGTDEGEVIAGPDNNSDMLMIKRGESCPGGKVVNPKTNANFKIADNVSCGIVKNEVVLVSNCEGGDFFGVSNTPITGPGEATLTTGAGINIDNQVSGNYGTDAEIFKLRTIVYYIGNGASGRPSLFKRSLDAGVFKNQELVEDIEDMTITYGVDTNGNGSADYYVAAADISSPTPDNWDKVISARIELDASSGAQNVVQSTTNADKRLRHTFTETIKIRNRF